jgi:hypothetical protein
MDGRKRLSCMRRAFRRRAARFCLLLADMQVRSGTPKSTRAPQNGHNIDRRRLGRAGGLRGKPMSAWRSIGS